MNKQIKKYLKDYLASRKTGLNRDIIGIKTVNIINRLLKLEKYNISKNGVFTWSYIGLYRIIEDYVDIDIDDLHEWLKDEPLANYYTRYAEKNSRMNASRKDIISLAQVYKLYDSVTELGKRIEETIN